MILMNIDQEFNQFWEYASNGHVKCWDRTTAPFQVTEDAIELLSIAVDDVSGGPEADVRRTRVDILALRIASRRRKSRFG